MTARIIIFNSLDEPANEPLYVEMFERSVWIARAGDIIVAAQPIHSDFLRYIEDTCAIARGSIRIVHWRHATTSYLTDVDLLDAAFQEEVRASIDCGQQWEILPCFYTPGFAEFCASLGLPQISNHRFVSEHGSQMLNSKANFRRLAAELGTPVPAGGVAFNARMLRDQIQRHIAVTGSVIVKRDYGLGGLGNVVVTNTTCTQFPGTSNWHRYQENMLDEIIETISDGWKEAMVVEAYHHDVSSMVYYEFEIDAQAKPKFLNSGSIRVPEADPLTRKLLWFGLDIPAHGLKPFSAAIAFTEAAGLAQKAAQLGYRGYLNIDAIVLQDGQVLFNEYNARGGGWTALHMLGVHLLGGSYATEYTICSRKKITGPDFYEATAALRTSGLQYTKGKTEGVLLFGCNTNAEENLEFLFIARTLEDARRLERSTLSAIRSQVAA
jgi:hypothetical protein